jgi:TetR/AcrR family transcriptional regulator, tetracycline repressor protein
MYVPRVGRLKLPLQRETVARAALRVLDQVGLNGMTMRLLAAELDIQNPTLYWHFTNKQELINCMGGLMIADFLAELHPARPGQDWAEWMAYFARRFRKMTFSHRDGARILAEADLSFSQFFDCLELALEVLENAGFTATDAGAGVITTVHYVLGNAYQEQADPLLVQLAKNETGSPSLKALFDFDEERVPRTAAVFRAASLDSPSPSDAFFEHGLSLILDGMRTDLAKERRNKRE